MKPSCQNCKFSGSLVNSNQEIVQICRRNSPQATAQAIMTQKGLQWVSTTCWPGITNADWCGEYTPELQS